MQTPPPAAASARVAAAARQDRVVKQLLQREIVEDEQVERAYAEWEKFTAQGLKVPMWRMLALDASLDREAIYAAAARVYAFGPAELDEAEVVAFLGELESVFEKEIWDRMIEFFVIPIAREVEPQTGKNVWIFATHDPTRGEVHRLLQDLKLKRYELRYAPEGRIGAIINEAFLSKNEFLDRLNDEPVAFDLGASFDEGKAGLVDEDALEAEISRSKLINLFEATLVEAVNRGASDIHIWPNHDAQVEIHLRVDGELMKWHTEERVHPEAFLAVVKDNSLNVDRFERDMAQDGFIQRWIGDALIRFRVSVLPIASASQQSKAESIVIRVLDDRKVITDLTKLGLLESALERFNTAIRQPHGMVILTGPTGSGKSTTLVASLYQVVTPKVNVLTVEDPVEYIIRGVRQIKLSHKLDLEGALRAILRHDPDVVMVGEMRDRQTAELAIKLANTGHLTFSTLHTNDAPSAVSRLFKMGIEPFLIAYALNLVVAQRLVRRVCPDCKQVDPNPDRFLMEKLGFSEEEIETGTFYKAAYGGSCKTCKGIGYKGRRAITETLLFTDAIRRIIVESEEMIDEDRLRDTAIAEGMLTLRGSAREYTKLGETTVEEVLRVTGAGGH